MLYDGTMVIEQLRVWKIYTLLSGVSLLILIFCLCVCVFFSLHLFGLHVCVVEVFMVQKRVVGCSAHS